MRLGGKGQAVGPRGFCCHLEGRQYTKRLAVTAEEKQLNHQVSGKKMKTGAVFSACGLFRSLKPKFVISFFLLFEFLKNLKGKPGGRVWTGDRMSGDKEGREEW